MCQQQSILRQIVINGYDHFTITKSRGFFTVAVYWGPHALMLHIRLTGPDRVFYKQSKLTLLILLPHSKAIKVIALQ